MRTSIHLALSARLHFYLWASHFTAADKFVQRKFQKDAADEIQRILLRDGGAKEFAAAVDNPDSEAAQVRTRLLASYIICNYSRKKCSHHILARRARAFKDHAAKWRIANADGAARVSGSVGSLEG